MKRIQITPRNNWQSKVENLGFGFHSTDVPYWDESAYYEFSLDEVNAIEKATNDLWQMCLEAVEFVIEEDFFHLFHIPPEFVDSIKRSWEIDAPSIYGRFDFAIKDGQIKLLEFNADTPTSLYEAAIVQWFWLNDFDSSKDQFNSIHEKLIAYWEYLKKYLNNGPLHFTCVSGSLEDLTTVEYLRDCAIQAKLDTQLVFIEDIGYDYDKNCFVDLEGNRINNIFKLYPYEWLINEEFSDVLKTDKNTIWIEPSWKMILSNKAILPVLWQLFPNHPNLLKCFFDEKDLTDFVRKPLLSREGANISIQSKGQIIEETDGEYGEEGFVFQELFSLPNFEGNYPVVGSWVIGQEAAGIGIRESKNIITDNKSRFVPHLIKT
jgi:glutathionylspermidine synthase